MNLPTLFKILTPPEREALALACDASSEYLRMCANGWRKPGPELCKRLVAQEPRLTLEDLRPDIWGSDVLAIGKGRIAHA